MRKKEAAWKDVLAASDEEAKERCMESYREEKIKVNKQERSEDIKANVPDPGIVEQAAEGKLPAEDKKKIEKESITKENIQ